MTFKHLNNNRFYVKDNVNEIRKWLKENISEDEYVVSNFDEEMARNGQRSIVIWFSDEANSVAFKLRWF